MSVYLYAIESLKKSLINKFKKVKPQVVKDGISLVML